MSSEKTEKPTDKKLRDAREKGQVAQSQDVNTLFITLAGIEIIVALKDTFIQKIQALFVITINSIDDPFLFAAEKLTKHLLGVAASMSLIVVVVVIVFRVIAANIQFGFLIAPQALTPSLDKLNPVTNIKNIFSAKKLIELATNIAKAIVLAIVFYWVIDSALHDIILMPTGTLDFSLNAGVDLFIFAARVSLFILGVIAVIDFFVQKHFFIKGQKMSKDEVFREYKQSEGDPQMKGERKAMARELVESGPAPISNVDDASAVVVNPTHFAIALRYVPGETPLPKMLCKGVDERAQDIIARARQNGIPIIRYVWLARTLFSTGKENRYIPRKVIKPVAAVFRAIKEIEAENEGNKRRIRTDTIREIHHEH